MKGRLERAGFKVSLPDPALALERKKAGRRRDLQLLAQGEVKRLPAWQQSMGTRGLS
jgi:hypothetical protein